MSLTAEVLEERVLLQGGTGTVNVQQVGTALVMTADANGTAGTSPVVTIYRLNASTVEVDGGGATLVAKNGAFGSAASSQTFAISSLPGVSSISVNLGTGYDEFYIKDLNVGLGGITFIGKSGGGTGDDLEVFNDSSANMTIAGNVTVRGNTIGSALAHTGSSNSFFELYTGSGANLTVNGSVSASQSGSGSGEADFFMSTQGAGNLTVNGSVTISGSGSVTHHNELFTNAAGSVLVKGALTDTDTGTGIAIFFIDESGDGNVTINENVSFNSLLNTANGADVELGGQNPDNRNSGVAFINGSLTVVLGKVSRNYVLLGDYTEDTPVGPNQLTVKGATLITSALLSTGNDRIVIQEALFMGPVVVNTAGSTSSGDVIKVDGATLNLPVLVTMSGPNAEIDIGDESGYGPTLFKSTVSAILPGPGDNIFVNGSDDGVTFVGLATLSPTMSGTLHLFNTGGISIPLKFLSNWIVV